MLLYRQIEGRATEISPYDGKRNEYRHTCPQCGDVLIGDSVDAVIQIVLDHSRKLHDTNVLEILPIEELCKMIQLENENYWAHIQHLIPQDGKMTVFEDKLAEREKEIVQYVVHGFSNKDIAKRLSISVRTVSTHLINIYEKLNIHSRSELVTMVRAADRIIESGFRSPMVSHLDPFIRSSKDKIT